MRIGEVERILMEMNHSIEQIAYECGYKNLSNLNQQYKELNEMSAKRNDGQLKIGKFIFIHSLRLLL